MALEDDPARAANLAGQGARGDWPAAPILADMNREPTMGREPVVGFAMGVP